MQHRSLLLILGKREGPKTLKSTCLRSPILRAMAWCAVFVFWYKNEDWRIKYSFLMRTAAHVSVIALALAAIFFGRMEISEPPAHASAGLFTANVSFVTTNPPVEVNLESAPLSISRSGPSPSNDCTVFRRPTPRTVIPERPRAQVVTHVVQQGGTLFDVAAQFGLSPMTIVWSNREAFRGAPWLVRVGTELFILPVDGVYHTVRRGETVAGIAAGYGADVADLYNEWNDLDRGEQPREGQQLVIPGGKGQALAWPSLPRYAAPGLATHSYGVFDDEVTTDEIIAGPGGHGWFTYPTGGSEVSGWVFHDPRQRMHTGIDYRCQQGDPIYAADNGVVTIAGRYGTYGVTVEIDHGNGFVTRYGHFSSVAVERGRPVYQGDLIGACGSTGWSSGAHLHFEVRKDGVPQDPETYLPPLDSVGLMAQSLP